jgi:hypothetical protein
MRPSGCVRAERRLAPVPVDVTAAQQCQQHLPLSLVGLALQPALEGLEVHSSGVHEPHES